jgi:two-component system response regulator YesN
MNETMLKVLIVDDERLVRELLRGCVEWERLGVTIAGECAGAEEAMERLEELEPDIVITDICMPKTNGLELCAHIAERYPRVKTVILTGHEEFEYAKEGIKTGVADFILKPVNDEEITKTVSELREKILAERGREEEFARLREQFRQHLPFLREKTLNELVSGTADRERLAEKLAYFRIPLSDDEFQVAVIEVQTDGAGGTGDEESGTIVQMRCLELARRHFERYEYVQVFFDNGQRIVVLCNDGTIDLWESLEVLKDLLVSDADCSVSIGVGNAFAKREEIRHSYREACDAVKFRYLVGMNKVISAAAVRYPQTVRPLEDDRLSGFGFLVKAGLGEKAGELAASVFHEACAGTPDRERLRVTACGFIAVILSVLTEAGIPAEEVFGRDGMPFDPVFRFETLPELQAQIGAFARRAAEVVRGTQGRTVRKIIRDVRDYIDANYAHPFLTLSGVAKKFSMNLSYLSRLFKEETGSTFVEYLGRVRMEHAIELLNETDKKAYQIAEEVGIVDPHYFSVCFKKHTGVSVAEYRKKA